MALELLKQYVLMQKLEEEKAKQETEEKKYKELVSHVKKIEISRSTCAVVIYADRKLKPFEVDWIMKRFEEVLTCPKGHRLVYFPAIGRYWCQECREAYHEVKCIAPEF